MENSEYWDNVAGSKKFTIGLELDEFSARVSQDANILDFGCGYGRILRELSNAGYHRLYGCDISQKMLNLAAAELPEARLKRNHGVDVPYMDNHFDAVLLIAVLTSIISDAQQRRLAGELKRVMKPGALLFAGDFLLNDDERNIRRYNEFGGDTRGVFRLPEGATLRHHRKDYILQLFSEFSIIDFTEYVYRTMNGHKSNGFKLLVQA